MVKQRLTGGSPDTAGACLLGAAFPPYLSAAGLTFYFRKVELVRLIAPCRNAATAGFLRGHFMAKPGMAQRPPGGRFPVAISMVYSRMPSAGRPSDNGSQRAGNIKTTSSRSLRSL